MNKFKEIPRMYQADEVDSEIAILTTSKNFWKKKALELQKRIKEIKSRGYWKEGDKTYVIEEYEYPHDENCTGTMCWCANRAKKENPKKWEEFEKKYLKKGDKE